MLADPLSLSSSAYPRADGRPAGWAVSRGYVGYPEALAAMTERADAIAAGTAGELVWLLEHPPLYTAGVSAKADDLLQPDRFPVYEAGRGGQYTYHGPGQRVAYVMLDLRERGRDVRRFVQALEAWVIGALDVFNVRGELREGRIGVWVERKTPGFPPREDKIAAIGVRVRHWVTFHGVSINLDPELEHFSGIVPCGVESGEGSPFGVTSLHDLGILAAMPELDAALKTSFAEVFYLPGDDLPGYAVASSPQARLSR
jgi:lipoyl(octanoyl) transferase